MQSLPQINQLKTTLDAHRPFPPAVVANLREDLIVRWTYHSNAIEGNTLTLQETKVVLEGITIGGKLLREHLEAMNHRDAIVFLETLIRDQEPLTEWTIRNLHQLILKGIDDANAGCYRQVNVLISGAQHVPPDQLRVPELMERFIEWHRNEGADLHPVIRAARVHSDFVKIHPFADGNGRTSRLLMNLELMKEGYPATVLPVEKRLEYYRRLDLDQVADHPEPFNELIADMVIESFRPYYHAMGIPWPV